MSSYHAPVLLGESLDLLVVDPNGIYVDVTYGGGGHSRKLLERLENGKLIAFDQDPDARQNLIEDDRLVFVGKNFAFIEIALEELEIVVVDGIIADLGVSSHQIDTAARGFSYRFDAPLDMRMDPSGELTAADVLNTYNENELIRVLRNLGEVQNARKVVSQIAAYRKKASIQMTSQLEGILQSCIPPNRKAKYLAQVYQALRIEVNGELQALEKLLFASLKVLKSGGRIAVIAYHSLEDRMVKRFFRSGNLAGKLEKDFFGNPLTPWKLITRKAITASEKEIKINPRARSARLRVAEKI